MYIYSNLATSIDGKIATADRKYFPMGTAADLKRMLELRAKADVVLFGAGVLRTFKNPCFATPSFRKQPINAVLSSRLEGINPSWPFFKSDKINRILFVSDRAPRATLRKFETSSQIILLNSLKPVANQVIKKLSARGVKNLLVEGGGEVMWEFVRKNLIDDYFLTLTPRVLGGSRAPTLVDGAGLSVQKSLNLELTQVKRVGDELYLTYRRTARLGNR